MDTRAAILLGLLGLVGCRTPGATEATPPPADIPDPPAMALHRLNRLEYDNTVRDLLGTTLRPARGFTADPQVDGFDNQAEALTLTPAQLDQYFTAAREIVDEALDPIPDVLQTFSGEALGVAEGQPVGDAWALLESPVVVSVDVPEGIYHLTLVAGGSQIGDAPEPLLALTIDGTPVEEFEARGSAAQLLDHLHTVHLSGGAHEIRYTPTNYVNVGFSNTSNVVTVQSLTLLSADATPGPGRSRVFSCEPGEIAEPKAAEVCAHEVLHGFATRAWRRPLTTDEQAHLSALYDVLSDEEPAEDALRLVLRSILISPKFLYRAHHVDPDEASWRSYELASRLSYFLWSSMPDDRLFELARTGALATPGGLADAARWMLVDPKAQGFLDGFAEQWLATRHLASASPSPKLYPTFDEAVRAAMVDEAKQFVGDYLRSGFPVVDMLTPGFAYRNDTLSAHYGLPLVHSDEMRRVHVSEGQRRGIMALGSWLVAQSHSDRSSPILRGSWIADHILCEPVPPPPGGLDIPELEPIGPEASVREALEQHRDNPVCSGCHTYLDVVGMGFEEFDAAGVQHRPPGLDTLGELPDGQTFEGSEEFAQRLDPQLFLQCVNRKLFVYGLGRAPLPGEEPLLEVELDLRATLPDLVARLVASPQFQPSVEESPWPAP